MLLTIKDTSNIVFVLQVFMFPVLLDDQSLVTEFQTFIEAVDDSNELTLAGHQQYPVPVLTIYHFLSLLLITTPQSR